jgi:hypothetical protein
VPPTRSTRYRKVPQGIWTHGFPTDVTLEWVGQTIPAMPYPYEWCFTPVQDVVLLQFGLQVAALAA